MTKWQVGGELIYSRVAGGGSGKQQPVPAMGRHVFMGGWLAVTIPVLASPCSKMWTVLQHAGPNHPGLCSGDHAPLRDPVHGGLDTHLRPLTQPLFLRLRVQAAM